MLNFFKWPIVLFAGFAVIPAFSEERIQTYILQDFTAMDSLPQFIAEAVKNNPGLKAAAYQVQAIHASPGHTWYLEDPEIGVEFYQTPVSSFPNPAYHSQEIDYSLQQKFPFPGKNSARIDAEHSHARMSEADLEVLKQKIIREVKMNWVEIYLLDRRLEINQQNQILLSHFVAATRKQYEVGVGKQADILRAQAEYTTLKNDSVTLVQTRDAMSGMLNALLNRNLNDAIAKTHALKPVPIDWTWEQIVALLKTFQPELQGMKAAIEMRQFEKTMALRDYYPDIMVRGAYKNMQGSPTDFWSIMVSMNIPLALWSAPKYKAAYTQSVASINQAQAEYTNMQNMTMAQAQSAFLKVKVNGNRVQLSKNILLPQAQQTLDATLASYQSGKTEFLMLLDAYRILSMAQMNTEMDAMNFFSSLADLEQIIGISRSEIEQKLLTGEYK